MMASLSPELSSHRLTPIYPNRIRQLFYSDISAISATFPMSADSILMSVKLTLVSSSITLAMKE